MLLCSAASEYLAVDIYSVEVVPLVACPELVSGACRNGATSTDRNSQLNTQQP